MCDKGKTGRFDYNQAEHWYTLIYGTTTTNTLIFFVKTHSTTLLSITLN